MAFKGVAVAFVAILVAGPATAAYGSFDVEASMPLNLQGDQQLSAAGSIYLAGNGEKHIYAEIADATLTRVIHRAFGYVHHEDPEAEVFWEHRVDRKKIELEAATLKLTDSQPDLQALIFDAQLDVMPEENTQLTHHMEKLAINHRVPRMLSVSIHGGDTSIGFNHTIRAGHLQSQLPTMNAAATGEWNLFLVGGILELNQGNGQRSEIFAYERTQTKPGTIYNPLDGSWMGGGYHEEYVHEYVVLEATDASIFVESAGATLFADEIAADVNGQTILSESYGKVVVYQDDQKITHHVNGDDLRLAGKFTLTAREPTHESTSHVTGSGDLALVAYGQTEATYDWAAVAAAATIGTMLVAAGAWLLSQSKTILGFGGAGAVAGYARVHGSKVLEHPGRQEVYDRVRANPGISMADLSRQVQFGASTLTYHLRVLEKNDFISGVKEGRHLRYFDRQTGAYANDRKIAASALRNNTATKIAGAILDHPGIAQRDLANRFGVAPSTINWHIQRLHRVGLVDAQRDHPHTRYYPGDAWSELPAEEYARFQGVA